MHAPGRTLFPYVALAGLIAATVWAVSFSSLPPADFTFVNGTEIKSIDPVKVSGVPEGRIINAMFEGLFRQDTKTLEPQPAIAERYELSDDQRTYTFFLRKDACWSDGSTVTAEDFRWSWRRMLHPEIAAEYAFQLWYIANAKRYSSVDIKSGDRVEVELFDRPDKTQPFPRGTILRGSLSKLDKPPKPRFDKDVSEKKKKKEIANWTKQWVYEVRVKGETRRFSKEPDEDRKDIEKCHHVLFDFDEVGIKVVDSHTLRLRLDNPTHYFLQLMAFYPLYPVNRRCVERYGYPNWTKPENAVCNGPFKMRFRRIRDRIRLEKSATYWNADAVKLNVVDAYSVTSATTGLNMYLNGEVDWHTQVPSSIVDEVVQRPDCKSTNLLAVYFYRLNTQKKALRDVRVRRALNLAIDKKLLCDQVLRAGQQPARSFVPKLLQDRGYQPGLCGEFNIKKAKELLAEAGYPGGKGIEKLEILYNTSEGHRLIAEVIQSQWKNHLGINVALKNLEWSVFLNRVNRTEYTVARAGWIGDYLDPNSFLDMFVSGGEMNNTDWSNKRYDEIVNELAPKQADPKKRFALLKEAEQILMDEMPIIPFYHYVSLNMVRPYVRGWHMNEQDIHQLSAISIDQQARKNSSRVSAKP